MSVIHQVWTNVAGYYLAGRRRLGANFSIVLAASQLVQQVAQLEE